VHSYQAEQGVCKVRQSEKAWHSPIDNPERCFSLLPLLFSTISLLLPLYASFFAFHVSCLRERVRKTSDLVCWIPCYVTCSKKLAHSSSKLLLSYYFYNNLTYYTCWVCFSPKCLMFCFIALPWIDPCNSPYYFDTNTRRKELNVVCRSLFFI